MQRHQQPTTVNFSVAIVGEADSSRTLRAEEQGIVSKQNVAVMKDTLHEDVAPPSLDAAPRAEPLSVYLRWTSHEWRCHFRLMLPKLTKG